MPKEYLDAVQRPEQTVNPLFAFFGMEIAEIFPGVCTLRLPGRPELIQGGGVVAGGVLATLLDESMAHAALALNAAEGRGRVATISMETRYLAPALPGADLLACARVIRSGKRVLFVEAEVLAGENRVAVASAQFMVLG
ncbi:MAG: PaaI family thioesterase [Desulfovibrio sp.]